MAVKTKIRISFGDRAQALKAYDIADGMIRIHYSPEPCNGTVLTEDGDVRNMTLGERYLYFGRSQKKYDPAADHRDCALSSLSLEDRTMIIGECSDLQGFMNVESASKRDFFLQLLFTAAILSPEESFEGQCLCEDASALTREETGAVYKEHILVLHQTRTGPSVGRSGNISPGEYTWNLKAAWQLKDGRFVRTDPCS